MAAILAQLLRANRARIANRRKWVSLLMQDYSFLLSTFEAFRNETIILPHVGKYFTTLFKFKFDCLPLF